LEIHRTQLRLQKITNDKVLDLENAARLASKEIVLKEAMDEKQANLTKLERELKNSQVCKSTCKINHRINLHN
jgi:translation initiation factor 1 (eIF-1/SUI1)